MRVLRLAGRGGRHDPRELTIACRFEGDFAAAFRDGRPQGPVPGDALCNAILREVRRAGPAELEEIGLALCRHLLDAHAPLTRVRVDLVERGWTRLEAGGRPQDRAFAAGPPETKEAAVTSNGTQVAIVAGLGHLSLMRTSGFAPEGELPDDGSADALPRLLVAGLAARWTYSSADVTFRAFRQGVRSAIVDAFSSHRGPSVQHTLYAIADIVLATYDEIREVSLSLAERPYRPVDLLPEHPSDTCDLFVALDEPVGTVEVTVERDPADLSRLLRSSQVGSGRHSPRPVPARITGSTGRQPVRGTVRLVLHHQAGG